MSTRGKRDDKNLYASEMKKVMQCLSEGAKLVSPGTTLICSEEERLGELLFSLGFWFQHLSKRE